MISLENLLYQFDSKSQALIHPTDIISPIPEFPEYCVGVFSYHMVHKIKHNMYAQKIAASNSANGASGIYRIHYKGQEIAVFMALIGAPACVALMEDVIAMGGKRFLFLGSCGVLEHSIKDGAMILPDSAIREEGTSFHYMEASKEIAICPACVQSVADSLDDMQVSYYRGKTWTTDACYRETRNKIISRKQDGCIAADMECSALAALAEFRKVSFAELFYAADNLDAKVWESRGLSDQGMTKSDYYIQIALESVLRLPEYKI